MSKNKQNQPSFNITGKNVVGSITAGGHAKVDVNQSFVQNAEDTNFERLFKLLEEKINTRPEDPNVGKQEIQQQINQIKAEVAQGEQANLNKLERWIRNLAEIVPDVLDVIVASVGGPVSGLTAVIQKIAARVKAESESPG